MPAEVETTFATTTPSGAWSNQNSTRSMAVLARPTVAKPTTVRGSRRRVGGMTLEYAASLRGCLDEPVPHLGTP